MKVYRGSASGARQYVEADRSRADDYYLTEGTGIAQRFAVDGDGHVIELVGMDGDHYEAWVAGVDPDTGEPRGRLRADERGVRFVEVIVNGPKTWSIAAETHPEIAAAYEQAQDRAVMSITSWLGQHATARVGPRGGQVAVPVDRLEVAAVRHYTSRAGDPHRHIHLQVNARVMAGGQWRGIDTVAIRDSTAAINGIGHAAVMGDPTFRTALAKHGFMLTGDGEIEQLTVFIAPFSKRATQISRNVAEYELQWGADNPTSEPGPQLRRTWDGRAWAAGRPEKNTAVPAEVAHQRWLTELHQLGYRPPGDLTPPTTTATVLGLPIGHVGRDRAAAEAISRVGSRRSTWNGADLRGEVELLLARAGVIAEPAAWTELAEDVTARATDSCVAALERAGVPEHIRALTSTYVIEVEADLNGRLAIRGAAPALNGPPDTADDGDLTLPGAAMTRASAAMTLPGADLTLHDTALTLPSVPLFVRGRVLDECQPAAVEALTGRQALVVVEGAAGAGKTTTLAATADVLAGQGHRLVVVTPTLKAAKVAATQTGATASSAAWLAHQYGWRWDDTGTWTRLTLGDTDPQTGRPYTGPTEPGARLRPGDLLVIDEAGMLDQDTARALLVVADECQVRVALLGDPHQLTAVGRGGVLQIAQRWTDTLVTLDVIHRFTHLVARAPGSGASIDSADGLAEFERVPDTAYAELSLAMRTAADPAAVFDQLVTSGHVRLHATDEDRQASVARQAVTDLEAGTVSAFVVDTREQARELNATIHRLRATDADHATAGIDDTDVIDVIDGAGVSTQAGEWIGVGDVVATRRNDRGLDVANRDTWTVTNIRSDGTVAVAGANGSRVLPAAYAQRYLELAYVTTAHGVQGDTTHTAALLMSEHTTAASAYVAMTRGQQANTVHIVADSDTSAGEQWVDAFARGKADLGLTDARADATAAASQYAAPKSRAEAAAEVMAELEAQWAIQADTGEEIERLTPWLDRDRVYWADQQDYQVLDDRFSAISERDRDTRRAHTAAKVALQPVQAQVNATAAEIYAPLLADWKTDRDVASRAAWRVYSGTGRFGRGRGEVAAATARIEAFAAKWEPVIGDLPSWLGPRADLLTRAEGLQAFAHQQDTLDHVQPALIDHARRLAEARHPEHRVLVEAVTAAKAEYDTALAAYLHAQPLHQQAWQSAARTYQRGDYYPTEIARLETQLAAAHTRLAHAETRTAQLSEPPRDGWRLHSLEG